MLIGGIWHARAPPTSVAAISPDQALETGVLPFIGVAPGFDTRMFWFVFGESGPVGK